MYDHMLRHRGSINASMDKGFSFNFYAICLISSGVLYLMDSVWDGLSWLPALSSMMYYFVYSQFYYLNKPNIKKILIIYLNLLLIVAADAYNISNQGKVNYLFLVSDLIILLLVHMIFHLRNETLIVFPLTKSEILGGWIDSIAWNIPFAIILGENKLTTSSAFAMLAFTKIILQKHNRLLENYIIACCFLTHIVIEGFSIWFFMKDMRNNSTNYDNNYYLFSGLNQITQTLLCASICLRHLGHFSGPSFETQKFSLQIDLDQQETNKLTRDPVMSPLNIDNQPEVKMHNDEIK